MATKLTLLDKLGRLDSDIAVLRSKLEAKLDDRRALLALATAQGEAIRAEVRDEVQSLTQASNLVHTGRIFTDDQVREIRRLNAEGVSQCELARRYGLSQPSIHRIVKRLAYADVA
jgi:DNA invertase Pin-like site-specific DNA recombinase